METFTEPKEMVDDKRFFEKRARALKHLKMSTIDPPIRDIIEALTSIRHCFTVQSCHGHIVKQDPGGEVIERIDPELELPETGLYQIAYLALVLENSDNGRKLYRILSDLSLLDAHFFQFGSADWFWKTRGFCNSYVIQVEPYRFRHLDWFTMDRKEAKEWLDARNLFFGELRKQLKIMK